MSSSIAPTSSNTSLCELLTWQNPIKTGKVFGSLILGLVVFKKVNLINIVFHLTYIALLFSAAAEYAGKLVTGEGFVTKYKPTSKAYAKTVNDTILPAIGKGASYAEDVTNKVIYSHDIETTLKAAGVSYVLYKLTSWFSVFTLLTTALVLAFTFPVVYSKNKKEIDAAVAQFSTTAKAKVGEFSKLAQDKAAPHVENLIKKSGPVGSFIKSKIPTRTAGSTVGADRSASFEAEKPTTATTTGASSFPEVPTDSIKDDSTFEDLVEEAKTAGVNAAHQL
ncbi:hypothetical protein PSN45_004357 [Yamadazyma tenuis]|uniref:Reticulon-like protein n=1 Tax=Candida tenuis (strain ATCC 10573 / BCRC 21748 / CBS 615 / JCM 9827 / NBRC 10315 / NRRL Y-1498 / VKM Y-70) TaxID=590646 RepID=G3B627_CANTC|nr:uncharacterized protein CANTEDRAFT_135189 [Yamadazyma tenuis ATCC 10573]XP_006687154.1 uncharacterized protein CANTEDRAFT_135189 [Yamadazyma tenuis ATCC 10573]EGV63360.1 hypothetical protein CANTEDRAFT_135189 [Yamadazyma tenuis ATCC 10573]EGV63361.1 hypothetical protein CANTEDRAFT_135189 [Yamadazyma tenuis ATCC 10573]WEJ96813.1 hypothetical protein PSN45_004357 [Yamadazyma tenuis]